MASWILQEVTLPTVDPQPRSFLSTSGSLNKLGICLLTYIQAPSLEQRPQECEACLNLYSSPTVSPVTITQGIFLE